ncbi:MAG: type II toxin-antitoxin system RelE/ParE family toxin [Fluviibacter sp.]
MGYICYMYTVIQIPVFSDWLRAIKDRSVQVRLMKRLRKAQLGNLGDVKQVGNGVWEMREFFGPGWRMYHIQRGELLIVMLGGGDKSTQSADIAKAISLVSLMEIDHD